MAQCEECREWHHDDYDLDPNGYPVDQGKRGCGPIVLSHWTG